MFYLLSGSPLRDNSIVWILTVVVSIPTRSPSLHNGSVIRYMKDFFNVQDFYIRKVLTIIFIPFRIKRTSLKLVIIILFLTFGGELLVNV